MFIDRFHILDKLSQAIGFVKMSRGGIEDVIVSMIPQLVTLFAGLISSVLIARGLGTTGMGYYALITSVSGFIFVLTDLGINHTAIRFASLAVSQNDTPGQMAVLQWAFRLRMALALFMTVLVFLLANDIAGGLWHASQITSILQLSLLICIFTTAAAVPMVYFQSLRQFRMNAIVSMGQTMISLAGILFIAWLNQWSLELVIIVTVIASFIGMLMFILLVPKKSFISLSELKMPLKDLVKYFFKAPPVKTIRSLDGTEPGKFALYAMISSIVVAIIMRSDVWLMGIFLDKSQVGIYSVAMYVTIPLAVTLSAINTALWPRASALKTLEDTSNLLKTTFYLSAVLACISVVYAIIAPLFIPLVFGPAYGSGVILGQILSIGYCIAILMCPIGVVGFSFGMVKEFWWINIIQLAAVIVVDVPLLYTLGPVAAALGMVAQNLVGFILSTAVLRRKMRDIRASS